MTTQSKADISSPSSIDFSSVLAAAVHDMKNSLCLLIQSIENLSANIPIANTGAHEQVANVHYEASRLNTNLVQILSLYRAELNNLPITVDECFMDDLFEDVMGSVQVYMEQKNLQVDVQSHAGLSWYLDSELIYLLINDVMINAMRYGTAKIRLQAFKKDDYLIIRIEDDGPGYPQAMLDNSHTALANFSVSQGRTGLGLFFARMIASAHTQGKRCGEISLSNGGTLGGSVFEVKLP
ncbi:HAMP domain-containing histidine kinase [Alteromonas pelagimontana]|uniref:histidine kinase n=1 Tax=Alteromonas pelagimontana TaxID=1858656 RepID=A0A6M4MJ06_9ALTE|nr:HAMP domain-containing sensor histidine kinase [Alteromonas pelagimontana]QJR82580.1 HAMP domain-containing histidine kinase [Alteromonas pelagimontana]